MLRHLLSWLLPSADPCMVLQVALALYIYGDFADSHGMLHEDRVSKAYAGLYAGLRPVYRWRYRHIPGPAPRWLYGNFIESYTLGNHIWWAAGLRSSCER